MNKNKAPQHNPYEWGEQSFTDTSDHTLGYNGGVNTDSVTDDYDQEHTITDLKTGQEPLISHPNVAQHMTTTGGELTIDPIDELVSPRDLAANEQPFAATYSNTASSAHMEDAANAKLRQNAEEIDRTIDALDEVQDILASARDEQEKARFWRKGKVARQVLHLVNDKQYLEQRANWLAGNDFQKDTPFDAAQAVARHDDITKQRLSEKQSDGVTMMDHLHEQALTMNERRHSAE